MKKIVVDLDDTVSFTSKGDYENSLPDTELIQKLVEYKHMGFEIIIYTARQMRTYQGNVGKINKHTLPNIINWLTKNEVPFDEIIVGKPWCGFDGFYVDDKAIRPSEFKHLTYQEIQKLIADK